MAETKINVNQTNITASDIGALQNEATKSTGLVVTGKGTANTDSRDGYSVIIGNKIKGATSAGGGILIGNSINAGSYFNGVALIPRSTGIEPDYRTMGGSVLIGANCINSSGKAYGVVIGEGNRIQTAGANAVVLGGNSNIVSADYAIQIGGVNQTNSDANTLKVGNNNGNFELMSADGTIPKARLANVATSPSTMPTLAAADWSNNTQSVTVSGVTASNVVIISPAPASAADYAAAGIICTAQSTDSLTFTCTTTPSNDIVVNVVII